MKMGTTNLSLTPEQAEHVRRTVARDFGNASEFFRDLPRERMKREIEADLALLPSATPGAPAGPSAAELGSVLKIQKEVRQRVKHAGGF